jgi:hypothetical protein
MRAAVWCAARGSEHCCGDGGPNSCAFLASLQKWHRTRQRPAAHGRGCRLPVNIPVPRAGRCRWQPTSRRAALQPSGAISIAQTKSHYACCRAQDSSPRPYKFLGAHPARLEEARRRSSRRNFQWHGPRGTARISARLVAGRLLLLAGQVRRAAGAQTALAGQVALAAQAALAT